MTTTPSFDAAGVERDRLAREVRRRRTFAIISHPDAGKTTLTEKLLLYGGAIELAGAVRGRKTERHATSDWMDIERQRGISISAAAIEFDVRDHHLTLLDTPGHQDFSEDTYRALLAVDSVVMVIDAAKGIESQTRKLFDVCRARGIPVLTFVNKVDQPSRDPFALLDEIERSLGVAAAPMNWPVGDGADFKGLYDLERHALLLYARQAGGGRKAPVAAADPAAPDVADLIGTHRQDAMVEAIALITQAGTRFDRAAYRDGRQTPVFFGSALHDFGVEPFLDALIALAPPPQPRLTEDGRSIAPTDPSFSGFVFKIQANMDPRHRDRVAFVRVCSGRLVRDMQVRHERLDAPMRLSRVYRFFGRDRETVDEACAGDVVGIVSSSQLAIGDTLHAGDPVRFPPAPAFPPERFATLKPSEGGHKHFRPAVRQLGEEGLMQVFVRPNGSPHPIVGVVGALQLDVVLARLLAEYGIRCAVDAVPYVMARWIVPRDRDAPPLRLPYGGALPVRDQHDREVVLFASPYSLQDCVEQNPRLEFAETR